MGGFSDPSAADSPSMETGPELHETQPRCQAMHERRCRTEGKSKGEHDIQARRGEPQALGDALQGRQPAGEQHLGQPPPGHP